MVLSMKIKLEEWVLMVTLQLRSIEKIHLCFSMYASCKFHVYVDQIEWSIVCPVANIILSFEFITGQNRRNYTCMHICLPLGKITLVPLNFASTKNLKLYNVEKLTTFTVVRILGYILIMYFICSIFLGDLSTITSNMVQWRWRSEYQLNDWKHKWNNIQ